MRRSSTRLFSFLFFLALVVLSSAILAEHPHATEASVPPSSMATSTSVVSTSTGAGLLLRTKTTQCVAQNGLPDAACTPGAIFATTTVEQICTPGYSASVRNVPTSEKNAVYAEYGILSHTTGEYEVDHLVSLELGGSNDIANLWPEAASPTPGFHEKDKVENYLHAQVCAGKMSLVDAQRIIATDWFRVYAQAIAQ